MKDWICSLCNSVKWKKNVLLMHPSINTTIPFHPIPSNHLPVYPPYHPFKDQSIHRHYLIQLENIAFYHNATLCHDNPFFYGFVNCKILLSSITLHSAITTYHHDSIFFIGNVHCAIRYCFLPWLLSTRTLISAMTILFSFKMLLSVISLLSVMTKPCQWHYLF